MRKALLIFVAMLSVITVGAQGLEYVYDDATHTAKVTYRVRTLGDGTKERIKGSYHGDIVIPETVSGYTVTGVGELAFDQCDNIPSVKFPNTMKAIEERAFCGCKILKEVIIPASVDTIYNNAFDDCQALEKVVFEDGENLLKLGVGSSSAESGMFSFQPVKTVYIGRPYRYPKVKAWGWYDYYDLSAFGRCQTLEEVTFGPYVKEIQPFEFILTPALKTVTINGTITTLATKAFYKCESLKSINLPEGLTTIGVRAFEFCKSLENIKFPSTLTMIDEYAFGSCEGLQKLVIPASVGSLGLASFTACTSVKEVILEDSPYELTLPYGSEGGSNGFFTSMPLEKAYIGRPYSHPETGWAGYRTGAFTRCAYHKEVRFGDYVTKILNGDFMELHKLQTVVLPKSLKSIGEFGFTACENLNAITCPATTPPVCSNYVFSNTDKQTCKLYVPSESIELYKAANVWKDFFNIEAYVGPDPGGEGTGDGTEFIVHLKAGGTVGYALASKPKVTLSGNVFTVTTTDGAATYQHSEVEKFTLNVATAISQPIAEAAGEPQIIRQVGQLTFTGCKPNESICIYSADGKLLLTAQTDANGYAEVQTSQLPRGIYVVKSDSVTIKIAKR